MVYMHALHQNAVHTMAKKICCNSLGSATTATAYWVRTVDPLHSWYQFLKSYHQMIRRKIACCSISPEISIKKRKKKKTCTIKFNTLALTQFSFWRSFNFISFIKTKFEKHIVLIAFLEEIQQVCFAEDLLLRLDT